MATVLDIGLLQYFKPMFTFLFVFGILYAILSKTKIFGFNEAANALFAFVAAVLFMLTPGVAEVINITTTWFIVAFIFLILLVVIFMFMGVKTETIAGVFSEDWVVWLLVILAIIGIFGFALAQVYGPFIQSIYGTGESAEAVAKEGITYDIGRVLFHPRLLGAVFILFVASQAVRLISKPGIP